MKKILSLLFILLLMNQAFANNCLGPNEHVPVREITNKIEINRLVIGTWKFSCTQIRSVAIAVVVSNNNISPVAFDWDDIRIHSLSDRKKPAYRELDMIAGNKISDVHYFWSERNNSLEAASTKVTYKGTISTIVGPLAYGSDKSSTTVKKLSSMSGLWYDPTLNGTGFNFTDTQFGLAITYYGYDINGIKNWLNGVTFGPKAGETEIGKEYTINLNQPAPGNGGRFDTMPTGDASGTMSWGTVTIRFTACDQAVATLKGLDGTQVFNLSKLAGNAGVSCTVK